jgi:small subunit ribosomal protein S6
MTSPIYDLMLLLDPQAEEAARAKIVADARAAIEARGELVRDDAWGDRPLTYPIRRRADAEYHLLQFHAASPELLEELGRTLRITDGILRFRLVKLKPGTPQAPSAPAAPAPRRVAEEEHPAEPPAAAVPARESEAATGEAAAVASADAPEGEAVVAAPADSPTGETAADGAPADSPTSETAAGEETEAPASATPADEAQAGETA